MKFIIDRYKADCETIQAKLCSDATDNESEVNISPETGVGGGGGQKLAFLAIWGQKLDPRQEFFIFLEKKNKKKI